MTTPGSIKTLLTGLLLAAGVGLGMGLGMGLVSPAQAGDVTVTEGETATFQITVTHKWGLSSRIRVYYSAYGGTATPGQSDHGVGVDGGDYAYRNPWVHYVEGQAGQPLTITVRTHTDDLVEGDETFRIKIIDRPVGQYCVCSRLVPRVSTDRVGTVCRSWT